MTASAPMRQQTVYKSFYLVMLTLLSVHYSMQKYDDSISLFLLAVREPVCQTHYDLSIRILAETIRSEECDENKHHRRKLVGFSSAKYKILALKMN